MCALLREVLSACSYQVEMCFTLPLPDWQSGGEFPWRACWGSLLTMGQKTGLSICPIYSLSIEKFPRSWPACFSPCELLSWLGDESASGCPQGSLNKRGKQSSSMVTQVVEMRERLTEMVAAQDATQLPQERRMQLVLLVRYSDTQLFLKCHENAYVYVIKIFAPWCHYKLAQPSK